MPRWLLRLLCLVRPHPWETRAVMAGGHYFQCCPRCGTERHFRARRVLRPGEDVDSPAETWQWEWLDLTGLEAEE